MNIHIYFIIINSSPYSIFIEFRIGIEHLKLQEKYTYELLEYLEALDPGRTWTKDQLLQNLQGVIIKKAHGVGK